MKTSITSETISPATPGQKKQLCRVFEDLPWELIVEKADPSKDHAQSCLTHGHEVRDEIWKAASGILKNYGRPNRFAEERTTPTRRYTAYHAPGPIEEQIARLRDVWPKLSPGRWLVDFERTTHAKAEGYGIFIDWESFFGCAYEEVLERELLPALAAHWALMNYSAGQLGENQLRLRTINRTRIMRTKINALQAGPVKLFAVQLGLLHAGESSRCARGEVTASEFMLDTFDSGTAILANPDRLGTPNDIWIDCSGDEYDHPNDRARWERNPCFYRDDPKLYFYAHGSDFANGKFGSPSGFLSES